MRRGNNEIICRSPGFSDMMRREGAPTVPPIPTSSLFPVPGVIYLAPRNPGGVLVVQVNVVKSTWTPPEMHSNKYIIIK
jgi:hypothetical protein